MRIHFIAIGGSAMHNLAIALHNSGHTVTGSDDQIFEPSYSRLKDKGLLPEKEGWQASHIDQELDAIILGMHARKDNPELVRGQELGINIKSGPRSTRTGIFIYRNGLFVFCIGCFEGNITR